MWLNFKNNVGPKKQIVHIKFKSRQKLKCYLLIHSHYGYTHASAHTHTRIPTIKNKGVINAKFRQSL